MGGKGDGCLDGDGSCVGGDGAAQGSRRGEEGGGEGLQGAGPGGASRAAKSHILVGGGAEVTAREMSGESGVWCRRDEESVVSWRKKEA